MWCMCVICLHKCLWCGPIWCVVGIIHVWCVSLWCGEDEVPYVFSLV